MPNEPSISEYCLERWNTCSILFQKKFLLGEKRHHSLLLMKKALIPGSVNLPIPNAAHRNTLLARAAVQLTQFFLQTGWIRTKPSHFLWEEIIHIKEGRILALLSTLYDTPSSPDLFTAALQRVFLRGGWRYPPCKSLKLHCPTKSWDKLTPLSKRVAKLLSSLHC